MQRDQVGRGEERVERGPLRAQCGHRRRIGDGITDKHAAAEGDKPADDGPADPPEPDNTHRHPAERLKRRRRADQAPVAGVDGGGLWHHLPREGEDEGERVVGDLVDAVVGHVADGNAAGPRGRQVDVVDADAVADDHPRPLHRGHDVGVHRGELRDHGIGIGDRRREGGDVFRLRGDERRARLAHDGFLDGEIGKGIVSHDNAHGTGFLGEREPHEPITVDCRLFLRNPLECRTQVHIPALSPGLRRGLLWDGLVWKPHPPACGFNLPNVAASRTRCNLVATFESPATACRRANRNNRCLARSALHPPPTDAPDHRPGLHPRRSALPAADLAGVTRAFALDGYHERKKVTAT